MLTFFEYLRQRAFESVLLGASEALEFLEQQQTLAERPKQLPLATGEVAEDTLKPPRQQKDNLDSAQAATDDTQTTEPRDTKFKPRVDARTPGKGKSKR